MTLYIANVNGDWWEYNPNDALYLLDTDNLPEDLREEYKDDMAAYLIQDHGRVYLQGHLFENATPH